jgi:hypothetical protein
MRRKKGPGGPEPEVLILRIYEGNPRALVEQWGIPTFACGGLKCVLAFSG